MAIEVLNNARIATLDSPGYGLIEAGALVHDHARILWVGPEQDLPAEHALAPRRDMGGRLVTPALIDCHTHIIFAGDRAQEFEMRLQGASYEDIARAGGGILSTVAATRAATEEALIAQALPRLGLPAHPARRPCRRACRCGGRVL
jgi:imidazolonepropionase